MLSPQKLQSLTIVGLAKRIEPKSAPETIGALWEQFFAEQRMNQVPHWEGETLVAVYSDYEGDHTQPYTLVIGCPVTQVEEVPEGMVALEIPGGNYESFTAKGSFPQSLIETWQKIWGSKLNRAYTYDLEIYDHRYRQEVPEVEVLIAVSS